MTDDFPTPQVFRRQGEGFFNNDGQLMAIFARDVYQGDSITNGDFSLVIESDKLSAYRKSYKRYPIL